MDQNNNMIIQQNTTQDTRNTENMDSAQDVSTQPPSVRADTQGSRQVESHPADSEMSPVETGERQHSVSEEERKLKERCDLINFRHRDLTRRHRVLFDKLRVRLPVRLSCYVTKERTLDMALDYINYLESLLGLKPPSQDQVGHQIAALAPPPGKRTDNGFVPPPATLPEKDPKLEETVESRPLCSMIPGPRHGAGTLNQGFIDMSRQRRHSELASRRQLFNDHWNMERPQSTSTPINYANQAVFPGHSSLATMVDSVMASLSGSSGYNTNSQSSMDSRRLTSADSQSSLDSAADDDDVFESSDKPHRMVWPERAAGGSRAEGFHSNPPRHHSSI